MDSNLHPLLKMTDYEFHTAVVDGEEVVGLAFKAGSEDIYAVQDPDTHDKYACWKCPRSGSVINHETVINYAIGFSQLLSESRIPASEWTEFRDDYISCEDKDDVMELVNEYLR